MVFRAAQRSMLSYEAACQRLAAHQQMHLLRWYDTLSPQGQAQLLRQLADIDFGVMAQALGEASTPLPATDITPCDDVLRPGASPSADRAARACGEQALRDGRVAVLLVAGGEGSRLGWDGPKGTYPLGAVSGRSLFAIHLERVLAVGKRYGVMPHVYVMTSHANHDATVHAFATQHCFGLAQDKLRIFPQGDLPAIDPQGRVLLRAKDALALSPNGNGGLFAALQTHGVFAEMTDGGVDTLCYIQVDNALAASADPLFIGYHLCHRSKFSCKAIRKEAPQENIGVFAQRAGRLAIVEYSEIPATLAEQRRSNGDLTYGYGNPGLFLLDRDFAAAQATKPLPLHAAKKPIRSLNDEGLLTTPAAACCYKLEYFALDALPRATRSLVLLVDRQREFAPVKRAHGEDSVERARQMMTALYRGWIAHAGGRVATTAPIEISPRYALDEEELSQRLPHPFVADGPTYLA